MLYNVSKINLFANIYENMITWSLFLELFVNSGKAVGIKGAA